MSKEFIISLACIVILVVCGVAKIGYDQGKLANERQVADAHKLSLLEARDKAMTQIKKIAGTRADDARVTGLSSNDKTAAGAKPAATAGGQPAAPSAVDDPAVKDFSTRAKISSLLLGTPKIVVIDKREYEEGTEIALPGGRRGRISEIAEEGVTLSYGGRLYRIAAQRELSKEGIKQK